MKLASAPTKERIIKLISEFYGGASITLHDKPDGTLAVHNSKGLIPSTHVRVVNSRFLFESVKP